MGDLIDTKNELDPLELFRKQITERLAADIGKLMPDEMLAKLINDSVHSMLYRNAGGYGQQTQPWIQAEVDRYFRDFVQKKVTEILKDKEKEVFELLIKQIEKQLPEMIGAILLSILQGQSYTIASAVQQILSNRH